MVRLIDIAQRAGVAVMTVSKALRDAPEQSRPAAVAAIREALSAYADGERVALAGAIWLVACRND